MEISSLNAVSPFLLDFFNQAEDLLNTPGYFIQSKIYDNKYMIIIPRFSEVMQDSKCRLNWEVCNTVAQFTVMDYVRLVQDRLWYPWSQLS